MKVQVKLLPMYYEYSMYAVKPVYTLLNGVINCCFKFKFVINFYLAK